MDKMDVCDIEDAVYQKCKIMKEQITTVSTTSIESQADDDKIKNAADHLSEMKVKASELSEITSKVELAEDDDVVERHDFVV